MNTYISIYNIATPDMQYIIRCARIVYAHFYGLGDSRSLLHYVLPTQNKAYLFLPYLIKYRQYHIFTYICILVRCHCNKLRFFEKVSLKGLRVSSLTRPHLNNVDSGLILVHRVDNDLKENME